MREAAVRVHRQPLLAHHADQFDVTPSMPLPTTAIEPCLIEPPTSGACRRFLAEPLVQQVEAELRSYWKGFWGRDGDRVGSSEEWRELCREALEEMTGARAAR